MISRYVFVCLYFVSFFLLNRWYDLYQYYFHFSTRTLLSQHAIPVDQLNTKQLQYILNVRGISYVNINEKTDLIQMVQQTGNDQSMSLSRIVSFGTLCACCSCDNVSIRIEHSPSSICLGSVHKSELDESIEDPSKRRTTVFTSYKQLLDTVDDCQDTIW